MNNFIDFQIKHASNHYKDYPAIFPVWGHAYSTYAAEGGEGSRPMRTLIV